MKTRVRFYRNSPGNAANREYLIDLYVRVGVGDSVERLNVDEKAVTFMLQEVLAGGELHFEAKFTASNTKGVVNILVVSLLGYGKSINLFLPGRLEVL